MKYMGSKTALLKNGLGTLLLREASAAPRFHDLFAGTGAVGVHIASHLDISVECSDIQLFAVALAEAGITRTVPASGQRIWSEWASRAASRLATLPELKAALAFQSEAWGSRARWSSGRAREICRRSNSSLVAAYGGHYLSPLQAVQLAALRETIPRISPDSSIAMSALVRSVSRCCASPGHTAQPFRPGRASSRYLFEAWRRDLMLETHVQVHHVASQFVRRAGRAFLISAEEKADTIGPGELAFVDPPYSAVQYSRFYHVLESVVRGWCGPVSGAGRYPPRDERPQSEFSNKLQSSSAMQRLLSTLAKRDAKVVVTFPESQMSNGLSGMKIRELAAGMFRVTSHVIGGRFSTLGGNNLHRPPTLASRELVLILKPR